MGEAVIHSIELEQNILGCFLVNPEAYAASYDTIAGRDFFDPVHLDIFKAIKQRFDADELVDVVILKAVLGSHEGLAQLGGGKYLVRLAGAAFSVSAIRDFCAELRIVTRRRELQQVLADAQDGLLQSVAPDDVASGLELALAASDSEGKSDVVSMLAATVAAADAVSNAQSNDGIVGVTSGIADFDRMIGGFMPGELILLGGRPSMGKTAVALSMAMAAARRGSGVCIVSLEMTPDSLAMRAVANEAAHHGVGMPYTDAKRGVMTEEQARNYFETSIDVGKLPIEILPSNVRDMAAIYSGVKKAKRAMQAMGKPLKMVIIDYLQLISPSKSARGRTEQITEISIAMKSLAMRLDVPVMALSQLSRALEQRDNKRPMLSDLRESGQLEQDADTVVFCYRAEYYLERDKPDNDDISEMADWQIAMDKHKGKMELIISKQRMGEIGTVYVGFNPATNYIWDE